MRYVRVPSLREGMICGKVLYDINSKMLLNKGSVIQKTYIDRIRQLGYQGVYIQDEISEDVVVDDVISDQMRMSAVKVVRDICIYSEGDEIDKDLLDRKVVNTKDLVGNIVDQMVANQDTMVNLMDLKFFDDYTYFHSVNVAVLSILVGVELGLSKDELLNLGLAAILHDIGKMYIDKEILNKPSKLEADEYAHMKEHPKYGYNLLKESYEVPTNVYVAVLQHHERFDGQGYPMRKAGGEISLNGRIICIADVYDALVSKRPYRDPLLPSEAMEYIMANGGTMFDLNLTKIFARKVAPFPVGTYVKLSSGFSGIVFENYEDACMRPLIKVTKDPNGNEIKPLYVDLRNEPKLRSVTITAIDDL